MKSRSRADHRHPGVFAPTRHVLNRLYAEFAPLYLSSRCPDAPENPLRVFNLAFRIYRERDNDRRLAPEHFLSLVYDTLGYPGAPRPGLFETFDVARYSGRLPAHEHFLNYFANKLRWVLLDEAGESADRPGCLPDVLGRPRSPQWRWALRLLPVFLACLGEREQEVVRRVYWDGLSFREAATRMGVSYKTVGRVHDGAVRKLKQMYDLERS